MHSRHQHDRLPLTSTSKEAGLDLLDHHPQALCGGSLQIIPSKNTEPLHLCLYPKQSISPFTFSSQGQMEFKMLAFIRKQNTQNPW